MGYKQYCKDYQNIENYEKALADNFVGWECHHRLETHNSDGERRLVDISHKELIALGLYYNRPANELIFLTESEHGAIRKVSEETRKKISEGNKGKQAGEKNPMYGKHPTDETRRKMREAQKGKPKSDEARRKMAEAHKGKPKSDETRRKMREAKKGTRWYNNGKINIMSKECPPGFTPGRIR